MNRFFGEKSFFSPLCYIKDSTYSFVIHHIGIWTNYQRFFLYIVRNVTAPDRFFHRFSLCGRAFLFVKPYSLLYTFIRTVIFDQIIGTGA